MNCTYDFAFTSPSHPTMDNSTDPLEISLQEMFETAIELRDTHHHVFEATEERFREMWEEMCNRDPLVRLPNRLIRMWIANKLHAVYFSDRPREDLLGLSLRENQHVLDGVLAYREGEANQRTENDVGVMTDEICEMEELEDDELFLEICETRGMNDGDGLDDEKYEAIHNFIVTR